MKTAIYSKSVQNEINAINEKAANIPAKTVKKRLNWELIGAIATMAAIIGVVYLLNVNGLIREF